MLPLLVEEGTITVAAIDYQHLKLLLCYQGGVIEQEADLVTADLTSVLLTAYPHSRSGN